MKYRGRHLLRRIPRASYGCFNPYVSFGDRSDLYIIDYFLIICICDLSIRKFRFHLLKTRRIPRNASILASCYLNFPSFQVTSIKTKLKHPESTTHALHLLLWVVAGPSHVRSQSNRRLFTPRDLSSP